jgi:hypothetical protein
MRRLAVVTAATVLFAAGFAGAALADGVAQHTHNLGTPGQGSPVIAAGFCQEAAHTGFHNFHGIVHAANGNTGVMSTSGQVAITGVVFC